jgi:hypothetical protein
LSRVVFQLIVSYAIPKLECKSKSNGLRVASFARIFTHDTNPPREARIAIAALCGTMSVGCLVGWSVVWSDGRMVGRLVGWSVVWSDGRSVGRMVGVDEFQT